MNRVAGAAARGCTGRSCRSSLLLGARSRFDVWLFGVARDRRRPARARSTPRRCSSCVLASVVVATAFHELGHASACRYGGARPGVMGVGVYLVWPAFYCDVTDAYRLNRAGRLRTDLGGVYFNAIFALLRRGRLLRHGRGGRAAGRVPPARDRPPAAPAAAALRRLLRPQRPHRRAGHPLAHQADLPLARAAAREPEPAGDGAQAVGARRRDRRTWSRSCRRWRSCSCPGDGHAAHARPRRTTRSGCSSTACATASGAGRGGARRLPDRSRWCCRCAAIVAQPRPHRPARGRRAVPLVARRARRAPRVAATGVGRGARRGDLRVVAERRLRADPARRARHDRRGREEPAERRRRPAVLHAGARGGVRAGPDRARAADAGCAPRARSRRRARGGSSASDGERDAGEHARPSRASRRRRRPAPSSSATPAAPGSAPRRPRRPRTTEPTATRDRRRATPTPTATPTATPDGDRDAHRDGDAGGGGRPASGVGVGSGRVALGVRRGAGAAAGRRGRGASASASAARLGRVSESPLSGGSAASGVGLSSGVGVLSGARVSVLVVGRVGRSLAVLLLLPRPVDRLEAGGEHVGDVVQEPVGLRDHVVDGAARPLEVAERLRDRRAAGAARRASGAGPRRRPGRAGTRARP